jgi:hypothetical protein
MARIVKDPHGTHIFATRMDGGCLLLYTSAADRRAVDPLGRGDALHEICIRHGVTSVILFSGMASYGTDAKYAVQVKETLQEIAAVFQEIGQPPPRITFPGALFRRLRGWTAG